MVDDRLLKTITLAKSGVYPYRTNELIGLDLKSSDIPDKHKNLSVFNVYRPASVLEEAVEMFSSLPFVHEHPTQDVSKDNFKNLAIGWTGESPQALYDSDNKEIFIVNTGVLLDKAGHDAYNSGKREVSPGYKGVFVWQDGVSPDGQDYQVVMTKIQEVNHLALVSSGRGGKNVRVLDSDGRIKLKSGLLHSVLNFFRGVKDSDMGEFRVKVEELVSKRETMSDDEMVKIVSELKSIMSSLPDGPEKDKLERFVDDLHIVKNLDDERAKKTGDIVANLFEKLDTKAMEETMKEDDKEKKEDVKDGIVGKAAGAVEKTVEGAAKAQDSVDEVAKEAGINLEPEVKPRTLDTMDEDTEKWTQADRDYVMTEMVKFMREKAKVQDSDKEEEPKKEDEKVKDSDEKESAEEKKEEKEEPKKEEEEKETKSVKDSFSPFNAPLTKSNVSDEGLSSFFNKTFKTRR